MTTRQRSFVRTPRKEKVWAKQTTGSLPADLTPVVPEIVIDILSFYKLDVGVSSLQRVTAMRIFGSFHLGNGDAETVQATVAWHWGIAWVPRIVSDAGAGDAQIPNPAEQGAREALWIQQGVLRGLSIAGAEIAYSSQNQQGSWLNFDITQMRKQPAADHVLVLVGQHSSESAGVIDPKVWLDFNVMLALP